mmetsp:Transcript_28268/g.68718  ORF Transcript_28268/g.68718 Transcript_28268/m.68718 type:complete len:109 (-) Transcript_28268:363-689(-)
MSSERMDIVPDLTALLQEPQANFLPVAVAGHEHIDLHRKPAGLDERSVPQEKASKFCRLLPKRLLRSTQMASLGIPHHYLAMDNSSSLSQCHISLVPRRIHQDGRCDS